MSFVYSLQRNQYMKSLVDRSLEHAVKNCRDKFALEEAKDLVPIASLVQDHLEILDGDYKDNLLPYLVDWFSSQFFSWFSAPDCEKCNGGALNLNEISVNLEGKSVENYKCQNNTCDYNYSFIRHREPSILLRTRRGRCGEWADCFMLILRALDYETRIVFDSTDHVWNEVWSDAQQRWIHVDPCESVVDAPLLYELGWSKKLQYCLAFSPNEALDVTRRYSSDFNATKTRRKRCDERWLEQYLDELTGKLLQNRPKELIDTVLERQSKDKRLMEELAAKPRILDDKSKLQGRKTGSLAWRIQRGEYSPVMRILNVINVKIDNNQHNDDNSFFYLYYNSDKNCYESSSSEYHQTTGWSSLVYLSVNLDHKFERDWKTSYISRYESCPHDQVGRLQWRFDLTNLEQGWKGLEVQVNCKIYSNTSVSLSLLGYPENINSEQDCRQQPPLNDLKLDLNTLNFVKRNQLSEEVKVLDLIAELQGGELNDAVAWQKPQLFRQTRGENSEEWAFIFKLRS